MMRTGIAILARHILVSFVSAHIFDGAPCWLLTPTTGGSPTFWVVGEPGNVDVHHSGASVIARCIQVAALPGFQTWMRLPIVLNAGG